MFDKQLDDTLRNGSKFRSEPWKNQMKGIQLDEQAFKWNP